MDHKKDTNESSGHLFGRLGENNQVAIPDNKLFDACVNDTAPLIRVEQSKKLAEKLGVRGTPTIIVNGWKLPVTPSSEDFDQIVKNVVTGRSPAADIDFRK